MRYLVTGAAGFIGSTLIEELLSRGESVTGVDCFRDYYDVALKRENTKRAEESSRFRLLEMDLSCDPLDPLSDLEGDGGLVVFHLAAQPGVRSSWGSSFSIYTRDNIEATQRLLEWARGKEDLAAFVYASSSSIYGNVDSLPMDEDTTVPRPYSPYGVTKLAAENLVSLYTANYGLPSVSCRFFTVYGPRQRPDMAFHRFFSAALDNAPIPLFGDGSQTRDFTYVDDIVQGLLLASGRTAGEIINLAGGTRVSIVDVLDLIGSVTGKSLDIDRMEKVRGDVKDTWASTEKAQRLLGWEPVVSITEGLERQLEWMVASREG